MPSKNIFEEKPMKIKKCVKKLPETSKITTFVHIVLPWAGECTNRFCHHSIFWLGDFDGNRVLKNVEFTVKRRNIFSLLTINLT